MCPTFGGQYREGTTGKTSIVERLIFDRAPTNKGMTEGIEISTWDVQLPDSDAVGAKDGEHVRIKVWDFGGQDIYSATHQFFITRRTLYLVVLDARQGEEQGRLDYWLQLVKDLSGKSPVLIVVNKVDEYKLDLDTRGIKQAYPFVKDIIFTSCIDGTGIDALRTRIIDLLVQLPQVFEQLPDGWLRVKDELEKMSDNFIDYERYAAKCRELGVTDEISQEELLSLLHDLGVVLCYSDDSRLVGSPVLNPEWLTRGIYSILSSPKIQEAHGVFQLSQLGSVLDLRAYPRHKHPFLVDLMQKFDLCFPLSTLGTYLLPDLFPKEEPALQDIDSGGLRFYYDYSKLSLSPSTAVLRLTARLYHMIDGSNFWRNGAVFTHEGNKVVVKVNRADQQLIIRVTGTVRTRRSLLSIIRAQMREIHDSLGLAHPDEWVPIPGTDKKAISYNALKNLEARGVRIYYDAHSDVEVDVLQLMEGIEPLHDEDIRYLQKKLVHSFSLEELRQLCFEYLIDKEDVPSTAGKESFARELLLYLQRRGEVAPFIALCRIKRSSFDEP